MFSRRAPSFLVFALLAVACADDSQIPTIDISDFRVNYTHAIASTSCDEDIGSSATNFPTTTSQLYRIHAPEGEENPRIDLYWKLEGDPDTAYTYFASGTRDIEAGSFSYAGGSFQEERDGVRVYFEVDGFANNSNADFLTNGREDYVLTGSTDEDAYTPGCVFTVYFDGQALAEQGDDAG